MGFGILDYNVPLLNWETEPPIASDSGTIIVNNPPVANFTANTTSITEDEIVNFTDISINSPTSWSWNFGDSGTSTLQNPSHTYSNIGTYTVSLTATNAYGSDTETKNGYISVSGDLPSIGDLYAGGIVFYLDGLGGGLVAALSNMVTSWGEYGTLIGGTSHVVGTGDSNTTAIVNVLGSGNYAAKRCDDLVLNGYNDWFLPSKDELNLMRVNLYQQGVGGFNEYSYWSSSEFDALTAWVQNFYSGGQFSYVKYLNDQVRAVRAF